ncbi:MAG: aminoacyl-tRNA hydrolase [Spirochaetales bacterium]|uniref:Peptidyl-tRNA hydrolase n=1 Tax=Candidatus Thalassospirochaeta sargassi TaxID=3119039 RepID=A0AAJ1MIE9_9SPIO|nr:aminoacyl-tRNA hydrolase [Spirochaetales bacterium]
MIISTYLGNTGRKYEQTRHNLAWMMLQRLSFYNRLSWISKFKGEYAKISSPESLHLKPMTLMNNSGESLSAALSFFKLGHGQLIVVHDDMELPFGTVQLKKGGGAGGHNGLRSIIKLTGGADFYRFRMGISRPSKNRDVTSWVLGRFSPDEEVRLDDYCSSAADLFETALETGLKAGKKIELLNL